jgi:hypothetical protein
MAHISAEQSGNGHLYARLDSLAGSGGWEPGNAQTPTAVM